MKGKEPATMTGSPLTTAQSFKLSAQSRQLNYSPTEFTNSILRRLASSIVMFVEIEDL